MELSLKAELTEEEIKEAIKQFVEKKSGMDVTSVVIHIGSGTMSSDPLNTRQPYISKAVAVLKKRAEPSYR